jgi:hypothetical protein
MSWISTAVHTGQGSFGTVPGSVNPIFCFWGEGAPRLGYPVLSAEILWEADRTVSGGSEKFAQYAESAALRPPSRRQNNCCFPNPACACDPERREGSPGRSGLSRMPEVQDLPVLRLPVLRQRPVSCGSLSAPHPVILNGVKDPSGGQGSTGCRRFKAPRSYAKGLCPADLIQHLILSS